MQTTSQDNNHGRTRCKWAALLAAFAIIVTAAALPVIATAQNNSLTAFFQDIAQSHNGADPFTVRISFSEDVNTTRSAFRNHVLQVTNRSITKAKRVAKNSALWQITFQPDSDDDVSITLPQTQDCTDQGAVCTTGGKMLSNSSTVTITGPAAEQQETPAPTNTPAPQPTRTPTPTPAPSATPEPDDDGKPAVSASQVGETKSVLITWSAVDDATGYRIERSKGWLGGNEKYTNIKGASTTQYTDTTVKYDTVYGYRVKARKSGPNGPWSDDVHVEMSAPPGTPDRPVNVSGSEATPGDVVITWQHPAGGEERDGYHLYRYNWSSNRGDVRIATKNASATSHTDSTVKPETLYSYHLRAYNEKGKSAESLSATITTQVQTPGVPNAPTNLSAAENTPGEVVLTWQAPAEGETITGYKVYRYRWTGGASDSCETIRIATVGSDVTSYTDDTVAPEVLYEYTVRAYNDSGRSSASNTASLTTSEAAQSTTTNKGAVPIIIHYGKDYVEVGETVNRPLTKYIQGPTMTRNEPFP